MHVPSALAGILAVAASTVSAQAGTTVKVTVGAGGALVYSPNNIIADVGTSVEFSYFPKNHSVIQSSFADPCHPLEGGFFSGFVPTTSSPSGTTFTIMVKDKKPIWIYCGQTKGNHCQSGMLAAINAPTTGNTLAAFTALARNATTSTSPPSGPIGGVLNVGSGSSTSNLSTTFVGTGSTTTSTSSSSSSSVVPFTGCAAEFDASVVSGVLAVVAAAFGLF